jgi:hypothetical protein
MRGERSGKAKPRGGKICHEVNIFDQRPDPSYGTGAIALQYGQGVVKFRRVQIKP